MFLSATLSPTRGDGSDVVSVELQESVASELGAACNEGLG